MISAKDRQRIKNKFGRKCAFCGCELNGGCHIWDIQPIQTLISKDGEMSTINTEIENLFPACKSCASVRTKHRSEKKMSIEEFRKDCIDSFRFLKGGGITSSSYGRAVRFGQIIETGKPIVFYFERQQALN